MKSNSRRINNTSEDAFFFQFIYKRLHVRRAAGDSGAASTVVANRPHIMGIIAEFFTSCYPRQARGCHRTYWTFCFHQGQTSVICKQYNLGQREVVGGIGSGNFPNWMSDTVCHGHLSLSQHVNQPNLNRHECKSSNQNITTVYTTITVLNDSL